jgi:hypothetical protein
MPGLEAHPQHIVLDVANIDVSEVLELSVYSGSGKTIAKVVGPQTHLSYVKIADAVIRISRRRKGTRSQ